MKNKYSNFWFFILGIYCVILISIEINISQEYARNFFADIQGDAPFYAINTSLSVILLLGTALMFAISLVILSSPEKNLNRIRFYQSQIFFFGYLALDDRFLIHEYIGHLLQINDALIMAGLGIIEIALILVWNNYKEWSSTTINYLLGATLCSAFMILIDGAFPREMIPRLSLEDLAKTWADTFIFMFSWSIFSYHINTLKLKAKYLNNDLNSIN